MTTTNTNTMVSFLCINANDDCMKVEIANMINLNSLQELLDQCVVECISQSCNTLLMPIHVATGTTTMTLSYDTLVSAHVCIAYPSVCIADDFDGEADLNEQDEKDATDHATHTTPNNNKKENDNMNTKTNTTTEAKTKEATIDMFERWIDEAAATCAAHLPKADLMDILNSDDSYAKVCERLSFIAKKLNRKGKATQALVIVNVIDKMDAATEDAKSKGMSISKIKAFFILVFKTALAVCVGVVLLTIDIAAICMMFGVNSIYNTVKFTTKEGKLAIKQIKASYVKAFK